MTPSRTLLLILLLGAAVAAPALTAAGPAPLAEQARSILNRNCVTCHGPEPRMAEFDLRSRAGILRGGTHGAAVLPHDPNASQLFRRITGVEQPRMPPTGPLSAAEIDVLRRWIVTGAPAPRLEAQALPPDWAFAPRAPVTPPAVRDAWVRNPVDAFVLRKLRERNLHPAPPADRATLLRRVTLDLTGLPPSAAELDAFLADSSSDAYEKAVDRLLASPHYGERWARRWLDLARFAESNGFRADERRENAWRYRDYLIRSFNEDKPYDRLVQEQIAGDELWPERADALIATAFNHHWADESNARNQPLRRQEILNDITDTVGAVVLGITVGCAKCHDHKYDPISQKDYYSLQAFFAGIRPRTNLEIASPQERAAHAKQLASWDDATHDLRAELDRIEAPVREKLSANALLLFPDSVKEAVNTPPAERSPYEWQIYYKVLPQIEAKADAIAKAAPLDELARHTQLSEQLQSFAHLKPAPLPTTLAITDVGPSPPPTHVLSVGVYDQPLELAPPAFLSRITHETPRIERLPQAPESSGRRAALTHWLTDPANPLPARVMANRIWQAHFGRGLAPASSNLGRLGGAPTHPELLDWLANQLVEGAGGSQPWSIKALHRLIVTSNTYRQSARYDAASAGRDPDDDYLWRMRRRRLTGEEVRDSMLRVSGLLNPVLGGPSVNPPLPAGAAPGVGWTPEDDPRDYNRRSVYVFVQRNVIYPLLFAFDYPDTHETCPQRPQSTTAPQALMLLNDAQVLTYAQALAGRALGETGGQRRATVQRAYRLVYGRSPTPSELGLAYDFLNAQARLIAAEQRPREALALPDAMPPALPPTEGAALVDFCHALLNSNEFLYVE